MPSPGTVPVNQAGTILGPSFGGLIYAIAKGPAPVYTTAMVAAAAAAFLMAQVKLRAKARPREPLSVENRAGRTSLHPREKNHTRFHFAGSFCGAAGRRGRAAARLRRGSSANRPLGTGPVARISRNRRRKHGATARPPAVPQPCRPDDAVVRGGFGAFTILFGVSRNLILSMVALILVGCMDMVSVVVRSTLVQLATPDEMRGRVNAVEMIFIGASNEIGQFESGLTAQWFGAVPAVILGGIGTLVVTALWAWSFPELRRVEKMSSLRT